ncbi:hypothetical protein Emed_003132 [Eimeria media]
MEGLRPRWPCQGLSKSLFLLFLTCSLIAVLGDASVAPPQQAGSLTETCRATLFPEGNPLLRHQPLSALRGTEGVREINPVSHPAFSVRSARFVSEHGFDVVEYVHRDTGIAVWSIQTPPSENEKVFSICFRTPVSDSYGTPHVLEHSVFQGSEKYPVTSLISALVKKSLNTYVNASTWSTRTCFPVASLNTKDFYNLASVYMDAVFHPLATRDPLILSQEGWRYVLKAKSKELADIDCAVNPDECVLEYSGVVLSEMKGVYSNPDALETRHMYSELFPDIATYVESSGGKPTEIPGLTFEHLQKFHKEHYRPDNAWITFYGPDDVEARLQFVDEFFRGTEWAAAARERKEIRIGQQISFTEPRYREYTFPSSASTLTDIVLMGWVLNPCSSSLVCEEFDGETHTALHVLFHLLMGNKTSPLYKALVDSRIGTTVSDPYSDFLSKHASFAVELKGVEHRDGAAADMEAVVLQTLTSLSESGFSAEEIAGALNTVEFRWRERPRAASLPRGVAFSRLLSGHINFGRDPYVAITFEAAFQAIRRKLAKGDKVFENLIKKYLLDNPHRLTLRMKASRTHAAEVEEEERQMLEAARARMTREELVSIAQQQDQLKVKQETPPSPEALQTLPAMQREDIDLVGDEIPIEVNALAGVPLITHELSTSGLVYIEVALSLIDLSLEDISYLPLLVHMLETAGTKDIPAQTLLPLIGRTTGGISASYAFKQNPKKAFTVPRPSDAVGVLFLSGKASKDQSVDVWCLLHAMLVGADFDNASFGREIIEKLIKEREEAMLHVAFRSARVTAESAFQAATLMYETAEGYPSLLFYRSLLKQADSDWSVVARRLSSIMNALLRRENLAFNVTGDSASLLASTTGPAKNAILSLIEAISADVKESAYPEETVSRPRSFVGKPRWALEAAESGLLSQLERKAYVVPTQVSDACLSMPFLPPGEAVVGSDYVGTSFLEHDYLFPKVRENLGAYGVWSRLSLDGGVFSLLTYRNPKLLESLEAFRTTPVVAESWSQDAQDTQLMEAVLPTISLFDTPISTEGRGLRSFWQWLVGETASQRRQFRREIINATKEDIQRFAAKLEKAFAAKTEALVLIGSERSASEVIEGGEPLEIIHVD